MQQQAPRVVVIGGGFAGLEAVRGLADADVRVTLVDRANHHLFQPLLYQVATAGMAAPSIAMPLRRLLRRQRNAEVLMAEVACIDPCARRVALAGGGGLDYDHLVVASGTAHAYFGHVHWARHAPGLKTLDDALAIRRRILLAFECAEREDDAAARAQWLRFVVIGGGATGVELAGTLAEIARHTLAHEFRHFESGSARVFLVEAGPRILAGYPEPLSEAARRQLESLGVEVRLDSPVTDVDAQGVALGDAGRIDARTVLWGAGVAASALGRCLPGERDRSGRVRVEPDLSLPGHAEISVAGDLAALEVDGEPVPGVAAAAKQMGKHVARAIRARLAGRTPPPFRYRDYGSLATIGRGRAVAVIAGRRLTGPLAWWVWLFAHVLFLAGFRNRMVALVDWAWAYVSWRRNARIILGAAPRVGTGTDGADAG